MKMRNAYDPPPRDKRPLQIIKGSRRAKVAEMRASGMSQRQIAKELGYGKSTIARDFLYLDSSEIVARGQDVAEAIVAEQAEQGEVPETAVAVLPAPLTMEQYRTQRSQRVIELVASKKTYRKVADELGVSIDTVMRDVTAYLEEYGDFGGRTMIQWRNNELLAVEEQLVNLQADMEMEPIRGYDASGNETWDLTPYQAANIRKGARKQYAELLTHKAKLLSLLVQRQEVDVQQTNYVVQLGGVDMSLWGPQIVEGTLV